MDGGGGAIVVVVLCSATMLIHLVVLATSVACRMRVRRPTHSLPSYIPSVLLVSLSGHSGVDSSKAMSHQSANSVRAAVLRCCRDVLRDVNKLTIVRFHQHTPSADP